MHAKSNLQQSEIFLTISLASVIQADVWSELQTGRHLKTFCVHLSCPQLVIWHFTDVVIEIMIIIYAMLNP